MFQALEPAALALRLQVAAEVEAERHQLQQHWHQRLERVRYDAERACRQYQAVEPENRLVARTLERQWEAALAAEATVQAEYARLPSNRSRSPGRSERPFGASPWICLPYGRRRRPRPRIIKR